MYFIDEEQYAFTRELAEKTEVLREEYLSVAQARIKPWHDAHIKENEDDWSACPLLFSGRKHKANWHDCKETGRLLEKVPGLITAGFYVLAPRAHLPAHNNHPRAIYRCHLGIIVPEGCSFRVGEETRDWHEGKWLIFDPNHTHEAWNRSDRHRVILLMDVWRDPQVQPLKDRVFHGLDSYKFAMAQNRVGRVAVDLIGKSTLFRAATRLLMQDKGEPELEKITEPQDEKPDAVLAATQPDADPKHV